MTFFKRAFLTAVAAATFIVPSQAASVTWDFTGAWSTTDYGPHGTTLAGSVTFNTTTSVATSFAFTVSGYPAGSVTYTMTGIGALDLRDNRDGNYDMLTFRVPVTMTGAPSLVGSLPWQTASFTLYDLTQGMLSSESVPTSVPNLATTFIKNVTLIYGQGTFNDIYNLTSLTEAPAVPEPASLGLIALGLVGVAVRAVRKRHTTL